MASNSTTTSSGIGLMGVLFIVFLVLKLLGVSAVAHWSWWWVTAPLWAPTTLFLIIAVICLIFYTVGKLATKK